MCLIILVLNTHYPHSSLQNISNQITIKHNMFTSSSSSMAPPFVLHGGFSATSARFPSVYSGQNGLISPIGNFAAPPPRGGGTGLNCLMAVERRHGRFKPVIKKPMVAFDDTYGSLLPYLSSPQHNSTSLSPDIFPPQEPESYNYPEMMSSYWEDCNNMLDLDGYVGNSDAFMPLPELNFDVPFPAVDFAEGRSSIDNANANVNVNANNVMKKQQSSGRSLSAQSIAARERRRKITEKTQELGKLIPGGNKMSTAEMLGSAFNYVKFMQAQLQLLQLMQDTEESNSEFGILVTSPNIQQKLYSEEKCLVPKELIHTIANHIDIHELGTYC